MLSRYNRLNSGEFCETPSIESLLWNEEQQSVVPKYQHINYLRGENRGKECTEGTSLF